MARQSQEVAQLISEINRCTEESTTIQRDYAQRLQELKLALAKVCGHKTIRCQWVWGQCTECGFSELIAWPGFANSVRITEHRREGSYVDQC